MVEYAHLHKLLFIYSLTHFNKVLSGEANVSEGLVCVGNCIESSPSLCTFSLCVGVCSYPPSIPLSYLCNVNQHNRYCGQR
mgnify:CR=1 FL=1